MGTAYWPIPDTDLIFPQNQEIGIILFSCPTLLPGHYFSSQDITEQNNTDINIINCYLEYNLNVYLMFVGAFLIRRLSL